MTITENRDPSADNPVASFEVGIMTSHGCNVGVCIKFSMFDRSLLVTHWSNRIFKQFVDGLDQYQGTLGDSAFMFRAHRDPSLAEGLDPRHPYHTLRDEAPELTSEEIGSAKLSTDVNVIQCVARGATFEARVGYSNGQTQSIFIHEYTALSLLGYLLDYIKAAEILTGPMGGAA